MVWVILWHTRFVQDWCEGYNADRATIYCNTMCYPLQLLSVLRLCTAHTGTVFSIARSPTLHPIPVLGSHIVGIQRGNARSEVGHDIGE